MLSLPHTVGCVRYWSVSGFKYPAPGTKPFVTSGDWPHVSILGTDNNSCLVQWLHHILLTWQKHICEWLLQISVNKQCSRLKCIVLHHSLHTTRHQINWFCKVFVEQYRIVLALHHINFKAKRRGWGREGRSSVNNHTMTASGQACVIWLIWWIKCWIFRIYFVHFLCPYNYRAFNYNLSCK